MCMRNMFIKANNFVATSGYKSKNFWKEPTFHARYLGCRMSSPALVHITEERVRELLNWEKCFKATETALKQKTDTVLISMPGYLDDATFGALGCKLVTSAENNEKRVPPLPKILANIMLFDETTGSLKAIVAGTEITKWRTAAASAVATKYIHQNKKKEILAIFGAGVQGKIHAEALQHFFKFKEVRIWNHNPQKANKLANELNSNSASKEFKAFESVEECAKGADVIVTATSAPSPFLKLSWITPGAHINSVGAGMNTHHSELEGEVYKVADIFIDHWAGAKEELSGLLQAGIQFRGEVGEVILNKLTLPSSDKITLFQSLGMATEDCAMARMILDQHQCK